MKATHNPSSATVSPSRPNGRPSLHTPELANAILALVREQGFSPTAAAEESGLNRGTLSRWRLQHPSFDERLRHARWDYRRLRLGRIRSTTTRDGRPNWRTAAWELEHCYPEEFCLNPKRRAAFQAMHDAEEDDLERARAEYEAELLAAAEAAPSPAPSIESIPSIAPTSPQKLQNSPAPAPAETVVECGGLTPPSLPPEPPQPQKHPTTPTAPSHPDANSSTPQKLQNPPALSPGPSRRSAKSCKTTPPKLRIAHHPSLNAPTSPLSRKIGRISSITTG